MYNAIGANNADIESFERRENNVWDWAVSGFRDLKGLVHQL